MTIYTEDPGKGINQPITNFNSPISDVLKSEFIEGFNNNNIVTHFRMAKWDDLSVNAKDPTYGKKDAEIILHKYGVDYISVPDGGLNKQVVDNVIEYQSQHLSRVQIIDGSPKGKIVDIARSSSSLLGNPTLWIVVSLFVCALIYRKNHRGIKPPTL